MWSTRRLETQKLGAGVGRVRGFWGGGGVEVFFLFSLLYVGAKNLSTK